MTDLRWTRETPTEPGWYWMRRGSGYPDPQVVLLDFDCFWVVGVDESFPLRDGEWAGPIPEPEEADDE